MRINLPVIIPGLEIGQINLKDQSIFINKDNYIFFQCQSRIECCSKLNIPVSEFDIAKIEERGFELDQIIESLSPFILPSKTPFGVTEKAYKLKSKPFDDTCTFLIDDKCSIHEYKPFACKIYPFSLDILDENRIVILIHQERLCKSIISADKSTSNNFKLVKSIFEEISQNLKDRDYQV
ncbi:MAG: YkgJ family cysteine cluster protein [Candidatus Kariarchaeaceae archaeon]